MEGMGWVKAIIVQANTYSFNYISIFLFKFCWIFQCIQCLLVTIYWTLYDSG